jgi:biofilm PGA synthesis protein PgaD
VNDHKPHGDTVVIEFPVLRTRRQRVRDFGLTALMWGAFIYIWQPLISLGAWLIGYQFAYDALLRAGGLEGLQKVAVGYGIGVLVIFAVIFGWSMSQRIRFRGKDRRGAAAPVSDAALADKWSLAPQEVDALRSANYIRLDLDEAGNIEGLEALSSVSEVA